MNKWLVFIFCAITLIIVFNLSYFGNSGLLIYGLHNAEKNPKHSGNHHANSNLILSQHSFEKFMSRQEAESLVSRLKSHQKLWERRNIAMSTLGTASYLDGFDKREYIKKSKKSNIFMMENYSDILEKVLVYFRAKCPGARVEYRKNAALPGFHIFDCNSVFSLPVASVHKDLQYQKLTYFKDEEIDEVNTMSFTLAIELPPGGGGLYTFENDSRNIFIPRPIAYSMAKKTKIDYKVGWIVTHNGQTSHMIAPCKTSASKKRITLQGHGIYEKNANIWWLYW